MEGFNIGSFGTKNCPIVLHFYPNEPGHFDDLKLPQNGGGHFVPGLVYLVGNTFSLMAYECLIFFRSRFLTKECFITRIAVRWQSLLWHWYVFLTLPLLLDTFPRPLSFLNFLSMNVLCFWKSVGPCHRCFIVIFACKERPMQIRSSTSHDQVGRKTTHPALFPTKPGHCVRRSLCKFNAY